MTIDTLVGDAQVVATVCNQRGDTGKGKIVDALVGSGRFQVCARGTGGGNAGHTVIKNEHRFQLHLLPVGVLYDDVDAVMGGGMVVNPEALTDEICEVRAHGISCDNLFISSDAQVVFPYHIAFDRARNQSQMQGGIGSTGKGIGPCYTDKTARRGISMGQALDKDVLARRLKKLCDVYPGLDVDAMIAWVAPQVDVVRYRITDTTALMHRWYRDGKRMVLEGAQGLLLSIEHGVHDYATSSDCSVNGLASGVGLPARAVDLTLGTLKFPFMTHVGGGPFPTELGGQRSRDHCADPGHTREWELAHVGVPFTRDAEGTTYDHNHLIIRNLMRSHDSFFQGVGVRLFAGEYGATTGRPRRIGWCDVPALSYAAAMNGGLVRRASKLVLTCVDYADGLEDFQVAFSYRDEHDEIVSNYPRTPEVLALRVPCYCTHRGYAGAGAAKRFCDLPRSLLQAMAGVERRADVPIGAVSNGPCQ